MVVIEITKRGAWHKGEMLPIGARLEFKQEPTGWKNKYRVVEQGERKLEVATPEPEKADTTDDAVHYGFEDLRAEYEEVFGRKPHHKMKPETMREQIAEANQLGEEDGDSDN